MLPALGYERASINAIAKAAKLSPGLVHYHFKSKEQILLALADSLAHELQQRVSERLQEVEGPRARVDAWIDALLALGTENFRSSFGEAVKQLRPIIRREKARSAGEVVATALGDSTGDDSVMVLVAMDVRVDNRSAQQGEERRFRLRLAMQRVEGEWLLDEIATVT